MFKNETAAESAAPDNCVKISLSSNEALALEHGIELMGFQIS